MFIISIVFIALSLIFMLFAILKTNKDIKNMNPSNKSFVMTNRSVFGVYNTGCSLNERDIYSLTDEELGL